MPWFSEFIQKDPVSFLTFLASFIAIASLWIFHTPRTWKILTLLTVVFAFLEGRILPIGILIVIALILLLKALPRQIGASKLFLEIIIAGTSIC